MSPYTKPYLSLTEQLELLASRGMRIADPAAATRWLSVVGYYRLSGYWYPYRALGEPGFSRSDKFIDGTSFDQVIALYEFDRMLKLLLLEATERFEIAMRVRVGHTLGRHGAYAHLDPSLLDGRFTQHRPNRSSRYREWLTRVQHAQVRSREDFVEHFRSKYDGPLPTWVVTEILEFGSLSTLYEGLASKDRAYIARGLGVVNAQGQGNGKRSPTGCTF